MEGKVIVGNIDEFCRLNGISRMEFEKQCNLFNAAVRSWGTLQISPTFRSVEKIVDSTGIPMVYWVQKGGVDAWFSQKHPGGDGSDGTASAGHGEAAESV